LLDFYEIDWRYEPTTFEVEWDRNGNCTQRFAPDFYLPEFDLYIEITTLNQKLVTKKNRKVRRLRALYPDVRCKILYQRDYMNLLIKYGLEDGTATAEGEGKGPTGAEDPTTLWDGGPADESGASDQKSIPAAG
jgi:hypothetical protein